ASRWMHLRRTVIGDPARVANLLREVLEAAGANGGQVATMFRRRRGFIEIDRDVKTLGDLARSRVRDLDALLHRRVLERNERHDVDRADTRMRAVMNAQIDARNRDVEQPQRRFT